MADDDDLNIYSEEVRDVLAEPPKALFRWGNTILFTFILLLLLLAYLVKYPDVNSAPIVITTQIPPEKSIARSSGAIEKILEENGEFVNENTPLAIIENTANYKDVFKLINIVDTVNAQQSLFMFPIEETGFLQLGPIESSYTLFEKDYIIYILNKSFDPYKIENNAQKSLTIQLNQRLKILREKKELNQIEISFKENELERYKNLYSKGIIAAQEWEAINVNYLQHEKNVKDLDLQISQLESSIVDLNKNSRTTKINEKKDQITLLRNTLQSYNQLKMDIKDWKMTYVLNSSIAGKLSYLQIWTENQEVKQGETIFTIIPDNSEQYIGKIKAPSENSGKLNIGQKVNIRLENYPYREYGMLTGIVKSISLTPDADGLYLIDVSLKKDLVTTYNKKIEFKQEMVGTANIITEDLRLLERFFYQIKDIFKR